MSMPLEAPAAIRRLVAATNAEDGAAFLDSFTDDGVVDDWGREFIGREAIAGWNEGENIGVHSRFSVHRVTRDGPAYSASVTVEGDGYNGGGTFTFLLDGDRIARFTIR